MMMVIVRLLVAKIWLQVCVCHADKLDAERDRYSTRSDFAIQARQEDVPISHQNWLTKAQCWHRDYVDFPVRAPDQNFVMPFTIAPRKIG
jgi:hypothetical protein